MPSVIITKVSYVSVVVVGSIEKNKIKPTRRKTKAIVHCVYVCLLPCTINGGRMFAVH